MIVFRIISRTVLLIATIMLMMNSVLPHHHHSEEVCFINTHCSEEHPNHKHSDSDHNDVNHHHHENEGQSCNLINDFITPDLQKSIGKVKLPTVKNAFTLFNQDYQKEESIYLSSGIIFEIFSDALEINTHSLTIALRGPPCC